MILHRASWATLLAATMPLASVCSPPLTADLGTAAPSLQPGAATLHTLCQSRCVLVDRSGKPASSCPYGGIADRTQGFSVLGSGSNREIVTSGGFNARPDDFQILEVHGNGLVEARVATRGESVTFYNRAGQQVRHFDTGDGSYRLEVDNWAGAPVVTRCGPDGCTAFLLGPDGHITAQFARLDVLEGHDVAAASTDGQHFGLIDTQLVWQGRRDYDEILAGDPLLGRRDGGLTVLDAQGRELIPLGDYQSVGRRDTGAITAKMASDGTCLYFNHQGDLEPARSAQCLLRGDGALGYYIFGNDTTSYVGADDGTPMSQWIAGVLLPLNRHAIAHVAVGGPNDGAVGTISPQGTLRLPHRYQQLSAFRTEEAGGVRRDDLLIASVEEGTGVIDLDGHWRIAPRYMQVHPLSNALISAWEAGGQWKIFDASGAATGASHFIRPRVVDLLDGTRGIIASAGGRMGVMDDTGHWRVAPQYEHVTITASGGVIVYRKARGGHVSAHVFNLQTNETYPGLALDTVRERNDGLLEGYSAADVTRFLFTVNGEVLARVPVPAPPATVQDSKDRAPASRTDFADCAFHGHGVGSQSSASSATEGALPY